MTARRDTNDHRVDICVCTYRRKQLDETLVSLGRLHVPDGFSVRIIVTDNDDQPTARDRVNRIATTLPFPVHYVHAPASNISIARNACLDASDADFVAFIDDDETASPAWLAHLLATAEKTAADVVLGPAKADYSDDAPGWMSRGDFHSTAPVWVKGEIRTGYTCNVLLRTQSPVVQGRRFSLALGRTGGEDTQFFDELYNAGGKIGFAPDAWVQDPVPPSRARFSWLAKRRFRMGQTHGRLLAGKTTGLGRAKEAGLALAKAAFCFGAALVLMIAPVKRNRYALRGILHVGVVSGLIGIREIQQYGDTSPLDFGGGKSGAA